MTSPVVVSPKIKTDSDHAAALAAAAAASTAAATANTLAMAANTSASTASQAANQAQATGDSANTSATAAAALAQQALAAAQSGTPGGVVAANNGTDFANPATTLANLGGVNQSVVTAAQNAAVSTAAADATSKANAAQTAATSAAATDATTKANAAQAGAVATAATDASNKASAAQTAATTTAASDATTKAANAQTAATNAAASDATTKANTAQTNAVSAAATAAASASKSADTITDGSTKGAFLLTERTKLSGIASGATANTVGTTTGTVAAGDDSRIVNATTAAAAAASAASASKSADTITNGTTNVSMLATERTKLTGIATGATANTVGTTAGTVAAGNDSRITGAAPLSVIGDLTTVTGGAKTDVVSGINAAIAVAKARNAKEKFVLDDYLAVPDLIDRYACMMVTAAAAGSAVLTDVGLPAPVAGTAFTATTGGFIAGGQTLYYVYSGVNAYGQTVISNEVSIVIPATTNTNRVTLAATLAAGMTSWNIFRSTTSGSGYVFLTNQTAASSNFSDTIATPPGGVTVPTSNTTQAGLFTNADVGKLVGVKASGPSYTKWTGVTTYSNTGGTITGFIDANNVQISQATTTGSTAITTRVDCAYGTDNALPLANAIAAAKTVTNGISNAATIAAPGRYASSQIGASDWASYLSFGGNGYGKSKISLIVPTGPGNALLTGKAPILTPYSDITIFDIEMDGSYIGGIAYNVAYKALYFQCTRRLTIKNVYVHDFPASGIGCDYGVDGLIEGCIVNDNGRLNGTTQQLGGSGVGVGTGFYSIENVTVANCQASRNGNYDFFAERNGSLYSMGIKFSNLTSNGGQWSFGDAGNRGMTMIGCTSIAPLKDSFYVGPGTVSSPPGWDGKISSCLSINAGRYGVHIDGTTTGTSTATQGRYTVRDFTCKGSTSDAIHVTGGANPLPYLSFRDCDLKENTGVGVNIVAGAGLISNLLITGVDVRANTGGTITYSGAGAVTSTWIIDRNPGYTLGPVAVTVTASPMTYTAGPTPEEVYIDGGTVSSITKGGVTLATSTNRVIRLGPNEATTVTYSAAPTISSDRR